MYMCGAGCQIVYGAAIYAQDQSYGQTGHLYHFHARFMQLLCVNDGEWMPAEKYAVANY